MKKCYVFISLFLFLLSSCNTDLKKARRYYSQAQAVFATDQDSALILIDSILSINVFLADDIRMNMALMQAEAIFTHPDGERREPSNRIKAKKIYTMPELECAADYFADKRDYHKASLAALYSGYLARETHIDDTAIVSFKNAMKYAEIAGDSLTIIRAMYNVAHVLMDKMLFDDALQVLDKVYKSSLNDCCDKARTLNMMAVANIMLNNYAKAEECLKMGMLYVEKADDAQLRWNLMNNYSVFYRKKGNYRQAIQCLRQIENDTDSTKMINLYVNMGKVFIICHENDSAAECFDKVQTLLRNDNIKPATKLSAYGALANFATLQNDYKLALKYREKHGSMQYQIMDSLRKDNIYRIQRQYDYETMQNIKNRQIITNYRVETTMTVVIIIILVVVIVLYHRIIQKNKRENEIAATLVRVMNDNKDLLQDKTENISEKLRSMQRLEILMKDQKDRYLLSNLEKEMFGNKNHWEVMTELLNALYPGIYDLLKAKYPDMSELERRVYMLYNFKLSRIDEALLLDVSVSVLDKARGRVKKMIDLENLFDKI